MRFFLLFLATALLLAPSVLAHETGTPHLELPPGAQQVLQEQLNLALSVNFLIAFLAGIIGFVSPCGFAVFPAFFAFLFKERKRGVFLTIAFATGMMLSFIILGIAAGIAGTFFNNFKREFAWLSGTLLVVFGLMLLLNKGFRFLTFRMDHPKKHKTFLSIGLLGFFFAWGWTPCVGPILSGVLILAANTGSALSGALMLAAYAVGVAVPLLLVAYFSDKLDLARFVQGKHYTLKMFGKTVHTHLYNIIGGLLLIGTGAVVLIFGGTQAIEQFLVANIGWKMDGLFALNDAALQSAFFTSGWANIIGIALLLLIAYLVFRAAQKTDAKSTKFK